MKRGLIRLFDFLEKDYTKITYDDFLKVASAISESKFGVDTRNADRNFIKRFLQENFDDWRIEFKDFKVMKMEVKSEKDKLTHKDLITEKELEKLISKTTDIKYKTIITFLYESACRPEEALKLRWSDMDFNKNVIYLYSIKTGKKRAVPLNDCIPHLRRLKKETNGDSDSLIFPSDMDDQKIMLNGSLNYMLDKLKTKAGISKKMNCYIFRHTRLSQLITKLSPKVYEDIAGHSLATGMKTYAHLSQDIHIKEMKDKVFQIEELSESKREEFEKQIDQQQRKFNNLMEEFESQKMLVESKMNSFLEKANFIELANNPTYKK